MRYALFGAPVLFPTGVAMAFERMTYGLVYGLSRWLGVIALYRCLVAAMLAGRIVWGLAQMAFLGITSEGFTWRMFLMGAFLNAIPGIVIQRILIPAVVVALNRTGLVRFKQPQMSAQRMNGQRTA